MEKDTTTMPPCHYKHDSAKDIFECPDCSDALDNLGNTPPSHTPAPWKLSVQFEKNFTIVDNENCNVCQMRWIVKDEPKMKANARLIAAAPSLLLDLIDAVESLEMLSSGEWEPDEETFHKTVSTYKDTIAKARGSR